MATSIVEIVNSALSHLGEAPILTLNDDTVAAKESKLKWPLVRDSILREQEWGFAIDQQILIKDVTNPPFGFDVRFQLPNECLRVLSITEEIQPFPLGQGPTYKLVKDRYLLTNEDPDGGLPLTFISVVTDPTQYDANFVTLAALELALAMAYTLTGSNTNVDILERQAKSARKKARSRDAKERGRHSRGSDFINTRFTT